jgi:competence/damage-inducible protein CinA C-terminal domain
MPTHSPILPLRQSTEELAALLLRYGLTCATAESCTGGMVGAALTDLPGSSAWFKGGVIAYANEVKRELLDVQEEDLERYGAVSHATVRRMALGACSAIGTDLAVSLSGVAGPDGGSPEKPVGTVYIGLAARGMVQTFRHHFPGDREAVRQAATLQAVKYLVHGVHWVYAEEDGQDIRPAT